MPEISARAYARIGLLGNPSDGYGGRTISLTLENYFAIVTLRPKEGNEICILPHDVHDSHAFAGLDALTHRVKRNGFYGGLRLLLSTCHEFARFHERRGSPVEHTGGFSLSYETTIPKQAGLSGSSAIVTATLSVLEAFYGDAYKVPLHLRPNVALAAETALGITAGLQDRVVQSYTGLVFMDFAKSSVAARGYGDYRVLDHSFLPRLFLVWADNPGDSGAVHATVRQRWDAGAPGVRSLMAEIAELPLAGLAALERVGKEELASLMNRNFELRRELFGDAALGAANVDMVRTCQRCGAGAKFCGSGGAVVALCPEGGAQEEALRADCAAAGLRCEAVVVHAEGRTAG